MASIFAPARRAADSVHGIVYRDETAFCGWPFICGFWTTGAGDYLVAFQKKPANYSDPADINHDEVARVGPKIITVRSRDKGRTWDGDGAQVLYDLGADQEKLFAGLPPDYSNEAPVDFTDPDVLVASGATPDYFRPHSRAWIRVSTDGGHNWRHPILAPNVGLPSVSGHASPLVRPDGVFEPNAQFLLSTDDAALIHLRYRGIWHAAAPVLSRLMSREGPVDPSEYYFRTAVFFETGDRILVMYRGRVVGVVPATTPWDQLGLMMAGVAPEGTAVA